MIKIITGRSLQYIPKNQVTYKSGRIHKLKSKPSGEAVSPSSVQVSKSTGTDDRFCLMTVFFSADGSGINK